MPTGPTFSHRAIKRARLSQGRTVDDVAAAAGITPQALYRIEAGGPRGPQMATAVALAKALGLTLDDLIVDEGAA